MLLCKCRGVIVSVNRLKIVDAIDYPLVMEIQIQIFYNNVRKTLEKFSMRIEHTTPFEDIFFHHIFFFNIITHIIPEANTAS